MVVVIDCYSIVGLLRTDSILVVRVGNGVCTIDRACKLSAVPRHRVTTVGRGITACIIANFFSVVGRQLIRPALVLGCTTANYIFEAAQLGSTLLHIVLSRFFSVVREVIIIFAHITRIPCRFCHSASRHRTVPCVILEL